MSTRKQLIIVATNQVENNEQGGPVNDSKIVGAISVVTRKCESFDRYYSNLTDRTAKTLRREIAKQIETRRSYS